MFFKKIVLILTMMTIISCSSDVSLTTNTHSASFQTIEEKIDFLKKYIKIESSYSTLDYHIIFHDNSGGLVPGPSDWNIMIKATIKLLEISSWVKDAQKIEYPDLHFSDIKYEPNNYQWYKRGEAIIGVDYNNNEIVYSFHTM